LLFVCGSSNAQNSPNSSTKSFPTLPPADVNALNPPSNIRPAQFNPLDPKSKLPNPRDPGFAQGRGYTGPMNTTQDLLDYNVRLDPPGPEIVFRAESEDMVMERMRQENKNKPQAVRVQFPEKPVLSRVAFTARSFPPSAIYAEPNFVMHHRLYFEEKNVERFGWELGILQPIVSTAAFYKDVIFLPHNFGSFPHRRYDSSAGKCLPGDTVPYLLYPPELTITGGLLQIGTVVGLYGIVP
jgi:hypothetical protein